MPAAIATGTQLRMLVIRFDTAMAPMRKTKRAASSTISKGTSPMPAAEPISGDGEILTRNSHPQKKPNPKKRKGKSPD